jgi:hypothetical protein
MEYRAKPGIFDRIKNCPDIGEWCKANQGFPPHLAAKVCKRILRRLTNEGHEQGIRDDNAAHRRLQESLYA